MAATKISATPADPPQAPSGTQLKKWQALEDTRLEKRRESDAAARDQKKLTKVFKEYVLAAAKQARAVTLCGFSLWFEDEKVDGKPDWEAEYRKQLGDDAAEKLIKRAKRKKTTKTSFHVAKA